MEQLFCALKKTQQARDIGTPRAILDRVQEWKGMGENLLKSLVDCFSDIETRDQTLSMVRESLEERLRDLEEREKRFDLLAEGREEEIKLREEKLDEQLKLVHEHIESLEASQSEVEVLRRREAEKLKEIENREKEIDSIHWSLDKRLREVEKREREIDSVRGSLKKRLREVEKREKEFDALHNEKLRELALQEEILSRKKKEFVEEVKLANEKLREKQKLGCSLIERLEMALKMLEGMKVILDEKFKEVESWKTMAHKSLTVRLNEADLIRESLEMQFKELEKIEEKVTLFQLDKTQKLESRNRQLGATRIELLKDIKLRAEKLTQQQKLEHQLLESSKEIVAKKLKEDDSEELALNEACETLDAGAKDATLSRESANEQLQELEKSQSSVKELPQTRLKENLELSRLPQPERHLVKDHAVYIEDEDQQLECRHREVVLERNLNDVHVNEHELKQSELTDALDAHTTTEPDESVDLKHPQLKDRKTLEMFIRGSEKDLELMDDEIFKILLLSSDPAKLVLEVVEGLYVSHLGKGTAELKIRRLGIRLLDQLTKMSPSIQPCVKEAAIKLAQEWKSKISTTAENTLEVLGFLHLLAAYSLPSYFDKDELFIFLKLVARHEQAPELCRILGITEKLPGFIQNLINEKQYLLASTYIYECQLENIFPQAAVLNYYVKHSKLSAKAKCRREHYSPEAQDKAIASEIADQRVAIEHIIKYGLESDYSPDILTARIKQLERNRASLRYGISSSSSADIQKEDKSKRYWAANERKVQEKQHEEAKEAATARKAEMPRQGSKRRSSSAWKAQNWHCETEKRRATSPVCLHKP